MANNNANKTEVDADRAAEAIWNAEYLLVIAGPNFDEGDRNPFAHEYCDAGLVTKPTKLMGYWGALFNEYVEKVPHEGFQTLVRWRDAFFSGEDSRKRQQKRRVDDDAELEKQIARFAVFTPLISNLFQKAGIPNDEVYEPCGNLMWWQCAASPMCSAKLTLLDRSVRFAIDESTREAPPIKYVPERSNAQNARPVRMAIAENIELEELCRTDAVSFSDGGGRTSKDDDRNQRILRGFLRAKPTRVLPYTQIRPERFPDRFAHLAETTRALFGPVLTFPEAPPDEELPFSVRTADEKWNCGEPCEPPKRVSHFYQHFHSLCANVTFAGGSGGAFFPCDPRRYQADRELVYTAATQQKVYMMADTGGAMATKRGKTIRHNISVCIVPDGDADRCGSFPQPLVAPGTVPLVLSGSPVPPAEADTAPILYFSNVPVRATIQEPVRSRYHDVVRVNFPLRDDGVPTMVLPSRGSVSVVGETVVAATPATDGASPKAGGGGKGGTAAQQLPKCPMNYLAHVWQLVGGVEALRDSAAVARDPVDPKGRDLFEYVLESSSRYVVKIGAKRNYPDRICYMEFEVPTEHETATAAVGRCVEDVIPGGTGTGPASPLHHRGSVHSGSRPPVPTPNHVLCRACHDMARPFVLMNRPGGTKDEGFCASALATKTKAFKTWEKSMTESLKQDQNKSVVLLEVGCDKKTDVSRSYSEKLFKQLKSGKCTMVRIAPIPFEAKKSTQPEPNMITLEMNPASGLALLERLVSDRLRKRS